MWLDNPTELGPHWKGPYRVVQVQVILTYCIVNPLNPLESAQVVLHDRLKRYTLPLPSQTVPDGLPSVPASPVLGADRQGAGVNLGLDLRSPVRMGGAATQAPAGFCVVLSFDLTCCLLVGFGVYDVNLYCVLLCNVVM